MFSYFSAEGNDKVQKRKHLQKEEHNGSKKAKPEANNADVVQEEGGATAKMQPGENDISKEQEKQEKENDVDNEEDGTSDEASDDDELENDEESENDDNDQDDEEEGAKVDSGSE